MKEVFDFIDSMQSSFLDELYGLVRIPSISLIPGFEQPMRECAEAFSGILNRIGVKSSIYQTKGNPVVYGESEQTPGYPTILIYGHYDVQPPGDEAEWTSPPFEPEIRNGRIYARGVGDNKGQIWAHIKAYEAYCAVKGKPRLNLKYLLEGEEEVGSVSLGDFIASHTELLKADITIWSDSNIHASGRPIIILGLKGCISIKITAKGPATPVHSQWGSVLANPVWKLVKLLAAMKDDSGRVAIPHFYDDYRGPSDLELDAIKRLPPSLASFASLWGSVDFDGSADYVDFYTRFMYEPTINIGCISAGNVEGVKNVIPSEASCWIDLRIGPGVDAGKKVQQVTEFVNSLGMPGIEVQFGSVNEAAFTPIENPFVRPVYDVLKEVWGDEPLLYPGLGGSGPFQYFNNTLKAPCIFVPFADSEQHDHAANENIPVENLMKGIKFGAAMIDRLSQG